MKATNPVKAEAIRDVIMLCEAESTYELKTRKDLLPVKTLTDIIIIALLLLPYRTLFKSIPLSASSRGLQVPSPQPQSA